MKLQIARKKYIEVEVTETKEIELVKDLTREQNRFDQSVYREHLKTVSMDSLKEKYKVELGSDENDPFTELLNIELRKTIAEALKGLSKMQVKYIYLHFYMNMSITEISRLEGKSFNTVKESIKSALLKLKNSHKFDDFK